MAHADQWVVGLMFIAMGLAGLYVSSRAHDDVMYFAGILVFIASVLFLFFQIRQAFDKKK